MAKVHPSQRTVAWSTPQPRGGDFNPTTQLSWTIGRIFRFVIKTVLLRSSLGWRGVRQPEESLYRRRAAHCPVHGRQACAGNQSPFQRSPHQLWAGIGDTNTTSVIVG